MTAIIVGPSPIAKERIEAGDYGQAHYMPFNTRHRVAQEINKLWEEFVGEMHDGPTHGGDVAEKFWNFVTR